MLEAVDPEHGGRCTVQFSYRRLTTVARRSPGHARQCAFIVPQVLQRPTAIFEGLRRDEDEDPRGVGWRCYCGVPDHAYTTDGRSRDPWPGQVFLVFVNHEGVAYNWRWERHASDDPRLPEDHQRRFRKRLL
jgi:hypothetical protein